MYTVTVEEASLQFAEVLRHTRTGEEVLLTENSLPIAKLVPLPLQSDTLSRDEKRDDIAYALGIAVARGDISSDTALLAREAWKEIERSLSFLPPPIVSTVENAQVMLSWDKNEHHLIIEIFPDKSVELFYSNRNTHSPWEYDSTVGASLPIEIVERIKALWDEDIILLSLPEQRVDLNDLFDTSELHGSEVDFAALPNHKSHFLFDE